MSVISIIRDTNNNVSIVRMIVTDTMAQVGAANYVKNNQNTINSLNGGTWQWFTTDMLVIACSDGNAFFTFTDSTFASLNEYSGAVIAFPILPSQGGTGVSSPTAHAVAVAEGASNFNFLTLTNGQLLVGSTGVDPVPATLTAGTNIAITNGAGSITINATGPASFTWHDVTTGTQTLAANNGYLTDNGASLVTYTLPAVCAQFAVIDVVGMSSGGWQVNVGAGQTIHLGNQATTITTGSLASTNQWDYVRLLCVVANTTFTVLAGVGNITIV
jgi:hypothetical protein